MLDLQVDLRNGRHKVGLDTQTLISVGGDPGPALELRQVQRTPDAQRVKRFALVRTLLEMHLSDGRSL
jgi:hypothetical protein